MNDDDFYFVSPSYKVLLKQKGRTLAGKYLSFRANMISNTYDAVLNTKKMESACVTVKQLNLEIKLNPRHEKTMFATW